MSDWYAHVTVATVIEQDGRFLLVEERSDEGCVFNQPAGHLEPGESIIAAAERETLEETGYRVALDGLLGTSLYTSDANGVTYYRTCFHGHVLERDLAASLDPAIIAVHWLDEAEIRARSDRMRSPLVLASVERYLSGQRWPLDVIY